MFPSFLQGVGFGLGLAATSALAGLAWGYCCAVGQRWGQRQ